MICLPFPFGCSLADTESIARPHPDPHRPAGHAWAFGGWFPGPAGRRGAISRSA